METKKQFTAWHRPLLHKHSKCFHTFHQNGRHVAYPELSGNKVPNAR